MTILHVQKMDLYVGILLLQVLTDARNCTASANTSNKYVNLPTRIFPDFRSCCFIVNLLHTKANKTQLEKSSETNRSMVTYVSLKNKPTALHVQCNFTAPKHPTYH
jgi:hypothetical protein